MAMLKWIAACLLLCISPAQAQTTHQAQTQDEAGGDGVIAGLSCELAVLEQTQERGAAIGATLRNGTGSEISFLPWNSVFGPIGGDAIVARGPAGEVPYQGPLYKRPAPTRNDYVRLQPGEAISNLYPISEVYALQAGATYEVSVREGFLPVYLGEGEGAKAQLVEMAGLGCNTLTFKVSKSTEPTDFTQGGRAEATPRLCIRPPGQTDCRPVVDACGSREAGVRKLHDDAKAWARIGLADFRNDAHYGKWFGAHTTDRFNKAQGVMRSMRFQMARRTVRYYCMSLCSDPNAYAFVLKGVEDVYFCPRYWSLADNTDFDSRVGTILHEISHIYADTEDHAYGVTDAMSLAAGRPWMAIENADNFQYYLEGKY